MNRTLLAFMLALCSVVSAQVEVVYPYNPDGNADSVISAPDLLDLLPIFGGSFTPEEITVNGEGLSTVLDELQSVLDSLDDFVIQASTGRTWQWPMGCHGEILTKVLVERPDYENCGGEYVVPNDQVLFLTTTGGTITAQRGAVAEAITIDPEFGGPIPIDEGVVLKNCNGSNVLISGVLIEKTPEVEIVFTDMEHVVSEGFFFKPYVVIAPLILQTGVVDSDGYPVESGIDFGGSVIATEGMSVSGSLIVGYQAPLDLFLTPANTEESASPVCEDIDEDGICDFADACMGMEVSFQFGSREVLLSALFAEAGEYPSANLTDMDLSGVCAPQVQLYDASLSGSNFSGANLRGAALVDATANEINLNHCDLSSASCISLHAMDASAISTNFSNADLYQAQFSNANCANSNFQGANLRSTNFTAANMSFCDFTDQDFTLTYLEGAHMESAILTGAVMNCLSVGCPSSLPDGYYCEPDPDCIYGGANDGYHRILAIE